MRSRDEWRAARRRGGRTGTLGKEIYAAPLWLSRRAHLRGMTPPPFATGTRPVLHENNGAQPEPPTLTTWRVNSTFRVALPVPVPLPEHGGEGPPRDPAHHHMVQPAGRGSCSKSGTADPGRSADGHPGGDRGAWQGGAARRDRPEATSPIPAYRPGSPAGRKAACQVHAGGSLWLREAITLPAHLRRPSDYPQRS